MTINGNSEFLTKTEAALEILKNSPSFQSISKYLVAIKEHEHSGMNHWAKPTPTYEVGERTWRSETVWYASCIAHDAYHSYLYETAKSANQDREPKPESYSGMEREVECNKFQKRVLEELGAGSYWLKEIERHIQNVSYLDIPYAKRDW